MLTIRSCALGRPYWTLLVPARYPAASPGWKYPLHPAALRGDGAGEGVVVGDDDDELTDDEGGGGGLWLEEEEEEVDSTVVYR